MSNILNLQEINQEQALNLSTFFIKANQNFLLLGRRGIAKTSICMQAAKNCGFKVNYINLSVIERPDLAGFPNIFTSEDVVSYKSPVFLPTLVEGQKPDTVIIFDEVDKCSPDITAPLLEILQFKKINGKPLNAVACLLTGNLSNEGAYSNLISTALLDRVSKYILTFSFEKWLEWAISNNVNDLIRGFLTANQDMACGEIETTYYADQSPRGWTLSSEALNKAKSLKINDIETMTDIVSGYVGYSAGLRFKSWYEYFRKFEPHILSYLANGEYIKGSFNEDDPNEKMIYSITLCYLAKSKIDAKNKNIILDYLCDFFEKADIMEEIEALAFQNAFSMDFVAKNKLYSHKRFFDRLSKLSVMK